jgi:hypothetical protein
MLREWKVFIAGTGFINASVDRLSGNTITLSMRYKGGYTISFAEFLHWLVHPKNVVEKKSAG